MGDYKRVLEAWVDTFTLAGDHACEITASADEWRLAAERMCEIQRHIESLEAEVERLRALAREQHGAICEVRNALHCEGRRPETCHMMSILDDARAIMNKEAQT